MRRIVKIQATVDDDNIDVVISSADDAETSAVLLVAAIETAKKLNMPVKTLLKRWLEMIAHEQVIEKGGTK